MLFVYSYRTFFLCFFKDAFNIETGTKLHARTDARFKKFGTQLVASVLQQADVQFVIYLMTRPKVRLNCVGW
jgi:hypothetical protein